MLSVGKGAEVPAMKKRREQLLINKKNSIRWRSTAGGGGDQKPNRRWSLFSKRISCIGREKSEGEGGGGVETKQFKVKKKEGRKRNTDLMLRLGGLIPQ